MSAAFDREGEYGIPPDHYVHRDVMVVQGARPWTRPESLMNPIWEAGIDGSGCKACVLDTGYTPHRLLPEPFAKRNFTSGNSSDVTDRNGHGNHCAGSVLGREVGGAPGAALAVGKVLGDSGGGSNTNAGLLWAADLECDVVSCSWGGGSSVGSSTERALQAIEQSGAWCVFAAGNSGYNGRGSTVIAPGLSSHNICVSSHNQDGSLSGFSSGGPTVDVSGGGGGIISCGIRGSDLVMMSGTSMATPTVAGDLLLLRQAMKMLGMNVYLDSRGLVKFLKSEEFLKDAGPVGRDPMFGEGIVINGLNILNWIKSKLQGLAT